MPDTSLLPVWVLSALALTAIYIYFKVSFSYWKKRGVPTLNPIPPFGDIGAAFFKQKNAIQLINESYKAFDGKKFGGLYTFTVPSLLVRDPEVIKDILVKDFDKFYSRGIVINEKVQPLQGHLVALSGSKWRNLRVKLSPTFTAGKMKVMFSTLVECGKELQDCLQEHSAKRETIEIKDILARYTTDVIASCAFGIQCNCLKNADAEFRKWQKKIFELSAATKVFRKVTLLLPSFRRFIEFPPKDVSKYFMKMVRDTVEYREKNDVKRNDFMQLLIEMKNKTLGVDEEEDIKLGNIEEDDLKNNAPFRKC
jgi:cytochrome P450 family 6